MKRRRPVQFVLAHLLPVLVAVLVGLTLRQIRQDRLNRTLIASIKQLKAEAAIQALRQGADARARDVSLDPRPFWRRLLDRALGHYPQPSTAPSALLVLMANLSSYDNSHVSTDTLARLLLERGADPNEPDLDGIPPLLTATDFDNLTLIRLLLTFGADPNPPLDGSRTPLMEVAGWGDPQELAILLNAGARIDTQDSDGMTALLYAVDRCLDDNVAYLLKRHADFNLRDKSGNMALAMATAALASHEETPNNHGSDGMDQWQHIIDALKKAGAKR